MSFVRSANLSRRLFAVNKNIFSSILLRNQSSKNSTPSSSTKPSTSTKPVDTEKMEEKFKTNPYFSKYESKLKALYNENPEGFLNTLKNVKPEKVGDYKPVSDDITKSEMAEALARKKKLDSIMKTEMLKDLDTENIRNIWVSYMKDRNRLAEILTPSEFETIKKRTQYFNSFLLALPREQGYEFILVQWSNNEFHFTSLINFQAYGENAPGIMTVLYYDDLVNTKNIIFEMAEMDDKQLKMSEAKYLIHQLKMYYLKASETDDKYKLMECFNRTPDKFKHMDIIKQIEAENLKLENFN